MKTQIVTWFTLAAFVNCLVGCSTIVEIPQTEVKRSVKKVVATRMGSGRQIVFDRRGGRVDWTDRTVIGFARDSAFLSLALDTIESLTVKRSDFRIVNLSPEKVTQSDAKILASETRSGKRIVFDQHGATINWVDSTIVGAARDSNLVAVALDSVEVVTVKRFSIVGTLLLSAGLCFMCLALAAGALESGIGNVGIGSSFEKGSPVQ